MTAIPEDMLLEIMKYAPKDISSTCKYLRNKFNIYDHWILYHRILANEKNVDFLSNMISFTRYYISGKSKKETHVLDKTKVVKLKISGDCDDIESYNNVREIKMEKPIRAILNWNLSGLKKKIYFSEVNTIVIEQLMYKNKNLEIEIDKMSVSSPRYLYDLISEKLKCSTLTIYFPITKETINIFMNYINCNLLIVNGSPNVLNEYTDVKSGKKSEQCV